jgi:hypothetical protein
VEDCEFERDTSNHMSGAATSEDIASRLRVMIVLIMG